MCRKPGEACRRKVKPTFLNFSLELSHSLIFCLQATSLLPSRQTPCTTIKRHTYSFKHNSKSQENLISMNLRSCFFHSLQTKLIRLLLTSFAISKNSFSEKPEISLRCAFLNAMKFQPQGVIAIAQSRVILRGYKFHYANYYGKPGTAIIIFGLSPSSQYMQDKLQIERQ